ncbi:UNKNOWN [Stylonychia lemnae]|uniref:Uncharacterized protein n=1 Tax=Stylonychia lemnae TaxID=5949 RepID=A0A078AKZ2_STYLE|nr:UNKNOWN [Stylonychia lemnae]|eukprot:CDW82107.1 UNKNOWN [Stylonychia lemnae]
MLDELIASVCPPSSEENFDEMKQNQGKNDRNQYQIAPKAPKLEQNSYIQQISRPQAKFFRLGDKPHFELPESQIFRRLSGHQAEDREDIINQTNKINVSEKQQMLFSNDSKSQISNPVRNYLFNNEDISNESHILSEYEMMSFGNFLEEGFDFEDFISSSTTEKQELLLKNIQ